jgi:alpha-L-arabinofuranosidase
MQFMEPLGVTDSSVEAAWNHEKDDWREDVIEATRNLAPGMMRWGGLLSAYYRWREAVGPRSGRVPMRNLVWGGIESNQVGTAEFIDFCRRVQADPLMCVNFESEGFPQWARTGKGEVRFADAKEAAEWVDYCNNPSNRERIGHGHKEPFQLKTWQLGNETSYDSRRFNLDRAVEKTIEFSKAMREVDPSIQLIAWGDSGWAKPMIERAGEHFDYIAFHHMFDPGSRNPDSVLKDNEYRKDPAATWEILMDGYKMHEKKILEVRQQAEPLKKQMALTECHYALPGRNRCEVLSSWAAGVSYARMMNLHERHGDLLKIATLADFCGTRWQVNAVMIPVPDGKSFLMPVAKIMSLYRKHSGKQFVKSNSTDSDLDVTASRTGNTFYLHVVNTNRLKAVEINLNIKGLQPKSCKVFELSTDPQFEILSTQNDPLITREKRVQVNTPLVFPPASVSAVEVVMEDIA